MSLFLRWKIEICEAGGAIGPMQVPTAQVFGDTNLFGRNGGLIAVVDNPTAAQLTAAGTTAGANIGTALNNAIAQIQGFNSGNP